MVTGTSEGAMRAPHRPSVAHLKALRFLREHATPRTKTGLVSFPAARQVLSWLFHLDKKEAGAFLREMEKGGLVTFHAYHGIKIMEEV
jgi:hypothetical protein